MSSNPKATSSLVRFSVVYVLVYIFVLRLLTEEFTILPRAIQLADKPMVAVFIIYLGSHIFRDRQFYGFARYFLGLLCVFALSLLTNIGQISVFPVIVHFLLLFGPFIWFAVLSISRTDERYLVDVVRIFIWLLLFQVAVGLLQLPRGLAIPDLLRGTFGYGYKQYVFYMTFLACILLGWYIYGHSRDFVIYVVPTTLVFLAARFLSVYPAYFLSLFSVYALAKKRRNIVAPVAGVAFLLILVFGAWDKMVEMSGESYQFHSFVYATTHLPDLFPGLGIVKSFVGWWDMILDNPLRIVFGTGPATFGSRAFTNIAIAADVRTNVTAGLVPAGYAPEIGLRYLANVPGMRLGIGSGTAGQPFNTYVGMLGELGLVGLLVFLGIYIKVIRDFLQILRGPFSRYLKGLALGCIGGIIFLAQQSMFYDFFSIERINLGLWLIIAVVYKLWSCAYMRAMNASAKGSLHPEHTRALS